MPARGQRVPGSSGQAQLLGVGPAGHPLREQGVLEEDVSTAERRLDSAQESGPIPHRPAAPGVEVRVAGGPEVHQCLQRLELGRVPRHQEEHHGSVPDAWVSSGQGVQPDPEQHRTELWGGRVLRAGVDSVGGSGGRRDDRGLSGTSSMLTSTPTRVPPLGWRTEKGWGGFATWTPSPSGYSRRSDSAGLGWERCCSEEG